MLQIPGYNTIMEDFDDALDFIMAPNNDLLAIHKYNTKFG